MLRTLLPLIALFIASSIKAQTINATQFSDEFEAAYIAYPNLPKGILEGVAFAQTRIQHISGNNAGCSGIPQVKGVMGLTENGQGYFNDNLTRIAEISGISESEIILQPRKNILAYACAFSKMLVKTNVKPNDFRAYDQILKSLSEIPWNKNAASNFALSCFTYEVFKFLSTNEYQTMFGFPNYDIDYANIYGVNNFELLSSDKISITKTKVKNDRDLIFKGNDRSDEYGPAIWDAAPSCNYSSRFSVAVSAVTVHTIQGSYAGAISWAQNCESNVSYHYVARSSDGQITQMVLEEDMAWHVGSENPYTIGIEHEGYVDDPAWYTDAMYIGSANLVKDITESGYGISPLRTFQGPATVGTLTLGACTRIKGHQHFPGASHTDPGINWDWEYYYQLINNEPDITTYTSVTGTIFDSGGAAENYDNDERFLYLIQPAGAGSVTLNTISFSLEDGWDFLYIYDGESLDAPLIDLYTGTTIPDVITSSGGSILLEFRSDCGITDSGWEISWTSSEGDGEGDDLPPVTMVELEEDWYTADFMAGFVDIDDSAGLGVENRFYQVIDYNGVEWRANKNRGFFSDNFDLVIHPDWTSLTGSWSISAETLQQDNEVETNTNIYATLNQNDYDSYCFHWAGKISGSGTDKRAGLHFMCDDPTLSNRGNSYFVWFREDDNKVQIYDVNDNVFTLQVSIDYDFSADIWYDFKTTYNKVTGTINVWVNNAHVASWTDDSPLLAGDYISFRSGNAIYNVNDLKVYHNRAFSETILVGVDGDARFQNFDPYSPGAKIKSIAIDSANNLSVIGSQFADIDWTPPLGISVLNDGEAADIETTTSNTELSANWSPTSDPNSGIARYWYAVGTTPGDSNIVGWTDNWYADTVTHFGLSLTLGETYYFSVAAENGAGLWSDTIYSNGQLLIEPTEPPIAEFIAENTSLCGLDSVLLENGSTDALTYEWFIPEGSPSYSTAVNPYVFFGISGIYTITLVATGPGGSDTTIQSLSVDLDAPPIAIFEPSAEVVLLGDATITFENSSLNSDGFYWDFDDGTYSVDESPWHTFEALGTYGVSLIAINGDCPNDTTIMPITITEDNAVSSNTLNTIQLFPNPANDFIILSANQQTGSLFSYKIYDASGRLVAVQSDLDWTGEHSIDITSLANGVYQIQILINTKQLVQQFVKE